MFVLIIYNINYPGTYNKYIIIKAAGGAWNGVGLQYWIVIDAITWMK